MKIKISYNDTSEIIEVNDSIVVNNYNTMTDNSITNINDISSDDIFKALIFDPKLVESKIGEDVEEFDIELL